MLAMSKVILKVKNLNVNISGREVLKNINFEVKQGEALAILGPNGAGKTILLKTILGLYPYSGKITLDKKLKIGYLPQKFSLNPYTRLTANELFEIKRKMLNLPKSKVEEAIKFLHLKSPVLSKQLVALSGGNLRKVFLVFTLIGDPDILMLDEPTSDIDLAGEKLIHESLHHLISLRKTMIIASHDLHIIHEHANRVLGINKEEICFGSATEMLKQTMLKKIFGVHHKRHHVGHKGGGK